MINPFKPSSRDDQAPESGNEGWCATLPSGRFGFGVADLFKRRAPSEPSEPPADLRKPGEDVRR